LREAILIFRHFHDTVDRTFGNISPLALAFSTRLSRSAYAFAASSAAE